MGRLSGFKYREVARRLRVFGFEFDRPAPGSHEVWRHPATGRKVTVPHHTRDMAAGTLHAILREAGINVDDFLKSRIWTPAEEAKNGGCPRLPRLPYVEYHKNYRWIVQDPSMLGGKPAIRGTRLSASLILACLAEGMSAEEIEDSYGPLETGAGLGTA
jgi:uncharacterized protein (DUF433 family)/predicted RNA binding protein YcfA (HicA-like mRNA interferase family)